MTIASLEKKLFTRDDAGFKKELFDILDAMEKGNPVLGGERMTQQGSAHRSPGIYPLHKDASFFDNQNAVQRLATCITGFLCSPKLELETLEIRKLIFYKTHLTDIFYLSDFGNLDHVMAYRDLWSANGGFQLKTDADVFMLMICWTINSEMEMPFETLLERIPQEMLYTLTAVFYQLEQIQTHRGFDNFEKAFDAFLKLPEGLDVSLCAIMLVNIWMGCSYWETPRRHEIKRKINGLIRAKYPEIKEVPSRALPEKPRVAILVERYRSDHAMYRCYHARIAPLKNHFVTALFAAKGDVDDNSRQDAHQFVEVDGGVENLLKTAKKIQQFQPDVIIYPSLGMNIWTVFLSNFHLAPVQIMGYGHPASAMSEIIDYGFLSGYFEGPDYQRWCTERLIPCYGEKGHTTLHPQLDGDLRTAHLDIDDSPVRVAINSSLMKISDRALQVCKLIQDNSTRPLEFHFFPAHNRGFKLPALYRKLLQTIGNNVIVHEPQPYGEYMRHLARCHFAIGTFPFGGTNTNIDAMLLQQPKIYLFPNEDLASYTDANDFMRYDTESGFVHSTELELVAQAIIWIHNPNELNAARERVRNMRSALIESSEHARESNAAMSYVDGIRKLASA
ncbi:hypothetical protein EB809_11490 [Marinobacter sp. R17]|uniref:hypothetical protein n=1 Tax=Marinobacter sp. R17 TaxID=2484250 RepID=UPI000F4C0659|nr:hypothetical protein [Marinobacter sp. R17]ROT99259.1 hypothetical protein EB809_11490 [Marinobacter sp. R17]